MNKKEKIQKVIMITVMALASGYFMFSGFSELKSQNQEMNSSQ